MLVALPVLLLFATVLIIWLLAILKIRPGTIWFVAAILVALAWGAMILVGVLDLQPIHIDKWLPEPYNFTSLVFTYSAHNWGFGFLLVSLLVGTIFSEAKYLDTPDYVRKISASILLTAVALSGVMAGSLLTFVISWAVLDLIEFGVLVVLFGEPRTLLTAVSSILFRLVGTFLLILLISLTPADQLASGTVEFEVTSSLWGLIILMVLFRTGTLPLFQPYGQAPAYQRGVVTLLRGIPLLITYAFIHFLVDAGGVVPTGVFWLVIVAMAILWGALSWFGAADEIEGRPYFLFTMAGFGLTVLMTGRIDALAGLAVVLVTGGAGLFLYSPRLKKFNLFILVLIAGMLSFPFTPSAPLARLFAGTEPVLIKCLWMLGFALLVSGMIKHSLTRIKFTQPIETWMLLFHTTALFFIAFSPWVLIAVLWKDQNQYMNWWPGVILTVSITSIMGIFMLLRSKLRFIRIQHKKFNAAFERVNTAAGNIFRINWLSRIFSSIGFVISKIVNLLARVMEGDGGILWSFLFVVLLLSILLLRQAP